ncbi:MULTISPECIES: hypothetical protein [Cellulosimicrobium]|uniref:Uncharacterized protein n=2 Tax=Cellulosimicrobium TaxID=157920 RepID=A0A0H2L7S7_9MICO|nr:MULTISPECIES: hypothetical protein [Cellulosimicrobium]KLN36262.1 hypothetical protein FB00_04495 [Cellulosimicrobium funkei]KON75249.1 hypothetical protein M768_04675 [Cellulosimicrobium cellulans F16]KZM77766.1 hypothetical protein A0J59_16125 [Cellulosimicrobium sp. I38E]MDF9874872.1 hypothetical protein [Cellulosimicrobium cellulans]UKJ63895.1 hypothetical protein H1Q78_20380 [Cellulosimicrobium cellulans]
MATVVPHPVHPSQPGTPGEGAAQRSTEGRLPPSYAPRTPRDDEPGAARSAAPVAISVGLLFGLAVAAAFVGRGLIEMLTSLVAGS